MSGEEHDDESLASGDRRENETEEEAKARKRKERLEQNRISARESRKRKKGMIEELQRTVITLSRENKDLNERNESLRRQLTEIGGKVCEGVTIIHSSCYPSSSSRKPGHCDVMLYVTSNRRQSTTYSGWRLCTITNNIACPRFLNFFDM
jgi:bZIP transcription factor